MDEVTMEYKFERLDVWKLAIRFNALVYKLTSGLPNTEKFNLTSQMRRASTSIALNIAEGSTGLSDAEQARFLSIAIRSYIEVIACLRLIESQSYEIDSKHQTKIETLGAELFSKLQAFRKAIS